MSSRRGATKVVVVAFPWPTARTPHPATNTRWHERCRRGRWTRLCYCRRRSRRSYMWNRFSCESGRRRRRRRRRRSEAFSFGARRSSRWTEVTPLYFAPGCFHSAVLWAMQAKKQRTGVSTTTTTTHKCLQKKGGKGSQTNSGH